MQDTELLEQQAVDSAINLHWEEAITFNKQIIEIDDQNISAFLRLGFAYLQLGKIKEARTTYNKALKLQPKNQVALDNIDRIAILQEKGVSKKSKNQTILDPNRFLESPGKTKTIHLVTLGQKNHLAQLVVGQEVELKLKKRKVEIRTKNGDYVGCLPDDLSKRLIFFLKAKSEYRGYIKEATLSRVVIFIIEDKKGKKVMQYTSFPQNTQTNMENLAQEDANPSPEAEEEGGDEEEWEKMANDLDTHEEKEEMIQIPPEEDEVEE